MGANSAPLLGSTTLRMPHGRFRINCVLFACLTAAIVALTIVVGRSTRKEELPKVLTPAPERMYFPDTLSGEEMRARGRLVGGTCEEIWQNWLEAGEKGKVDKPPKAIPEDMWNAYTLFGRIPVRNFYFNEVSVPTKKSWGGMEQLMQMTREEVVQRSTYKKSTDVVYEAMSQFEHFFRGKDGAVIGSQLPWSEIYALRHGARSVLTVEYQELDIKTTLNMSYIHPFELAKKWNEYGETLDFVVSFSSLEHSGLGRYGDPLDPFGDLREAAKILCLLKPKGVFIVGFPTGADALFWNAHRIYGTIRLPWILQGFKLLGVVWMRDGRPQLSAGFPLDYVLPPPGTSLSRGQQQQPAIVLQKV